MNNIPIHNGYDAKNKESLDSRYRCLICKYILRTPVQLICGHRICQLCIPYDDNDIRCPKCSKITLISQIRSDKGFDNDMQKLSVDCNLCEWTGQLKIYQSHLEQLHQQYRCSYCNEIFNSRILLNQHTNTACSKMMVNCKLQAYGCKAQILRCDLPQHYQSEEHQRILLLIISQFIATMIESNPELTKQDTDVGQSMTDLSHKVTTAATTTAASLITEKCDDQQERITDIIDILTGGIAVLSDDIQQLSNESLQQSQLLVTTEQSFTMLKTSLEESNAVVDATNTNMILLQQECSTLKQKSEEMQFISYDGTLIWKITDIQEKMTDAKSERQVSIYSPPFYSSPAGYKMCARIYLNGDGNARRTHMSLFFVLMRSLNDSLLHFPFNYKVTFCLYDQSGQQRHIIDSFRPDIKSNSFQRPRSDMNIASGIPKFVSLSTVEQPNNPYVQNDTMFIKVMVDFMNLPKAILPYALTLNPGIPTNCQQRMIQQEIERTTRSQSQQGSETTNADSSMSNQKQSNDDDKMNK